MADTQFKLQRAGDLAIVTIDNGEDWTKPTVFGRAAMLSLAETLDELEQGDFAALVLTGKPFFFSAGADIAEFPKLRDPAAAAAGSRAGHELFARIAALPYPTVAAINGAALGGGVEIALHCTARTISADVRHFGFPEVFLGIVPGWGGTQLVPRLVGPKEAVDVVVRNPLRRNRLLDARKALELGLVDRLLEPVEFLDESLAFARELATRGFERAEPDWSDAEAVFRRARNDVDDAVHGAAPAPYLALELLEGARGLALEVGYRREEEAFAELLPGRQAQASVYAFGVVERRVKKGAGRPEAEPRKIEKVGVVGAGLMATQLATLLLKRLGVPLVIRDLDQETVDRAIASIRSELEGRWAPVTGTTRVEDFAGCDLVIEAVFEDLEVKKQVFAELREVVSPECVLATNTSSLSVAEMGADLGIHFFNPVAVMPLVELVRHDATDDVELATAWDVASKLRKRAVLVSDAPGFVVNRVLTRMTRVLMDALEHGTPSDTVDEAILGLGMPMAPSVLLQMVGPRVANHVLETMHAAFPDRFALSPALEAIAAGDEPAPLADEPWTADEVRERAMEAVADEIHRMLAEGVTAEPADVDACLILGAGWPLFMGGATPYLDATGVSERVFGGTFAEMRAGAPA
ncbi:MAG TPA: 3-hydroxyacyl-CoA dehydrogenase NAD-binding domain-containing protein [Gaiellaceae bacterium]